MRGMGEGALTEELARIVAIEALLRQMLLDQRRTDANANVLHENQQRMADAVNRIAQRLASLEDELEFVEFAPDKKEAH